MNLFLIVVAMAQVQGPTAHLVSVSPGEALNVAVEGFGQPVVLLPGLIGSGFAYRKVAPLLVTEGFRVATIEPLGVGGSARPSEADYSLGAQAARVAAVLDSIGIRRAIVVAHAVGGSIGLRLAVLRPDLVSGLVLLEGGAAESASTPGFRRAMKFAPLLRLFGGVGRIRSRLREQLERDSGDPAWVQLDVVEGYTADAERDLGGVLRAYRAMAASREADSITNRLPGIRVPVRLLLGDVPHGSGPGSAEVSRMAGLLPDFAVDTVPGVGHFPHEESPDVVCSAVLRIRDELLALNQPLPPTLSTSIQARRGGTPLRLRRGAGGERRWS